MNYFTTTQVENKKELNMVPVYTEQEKKLMSDVPTYNFDTIIDYTSDNPNPKILFSTSYNFKEDYRSMFALTENQIHDLINLLNESLDILQAKREENETLKATLQIFSDYIIKSVNENKFDEFKVVFEELSGKYKNAKTMNNLTTFVSLKKLTKNSSGEFDTIVILAVSLDKEITLSINSESHKKGNKLDNLNMDSLMKTIERVIKFKFLGGIMSYGLKNLSNTEISELCKKAYDNLTFEFNLDMSDNGVIKQSIHKAEEESKEIMKQLDSILNPDTDIYNKLTTFKLSTPKPIKGMSKEEMDRISKEFMKEYKNKK